MSRIPQFDTLQTASGISADGKDSVRAGRGDALVVLTVGVCGHVIVGGLTPDLAEALAVELVVQANRARHLAVAPPTSIAARRLLHQGCGGEFIDGLCDHCGDRIRTSRPC